jgi:hypothetical protein
MKYLLFVCVDGTIDLGPEGWAKVGPETDAWVAEMDQRGARLQGNRLAEIADAATVRVRGGKTLITDGPFAATKEYIAGFDLLECADLDEAIEVASKHPAGRFGALEVRPLWEE